MLARHDDVGLQGDATHCGAIELQSLRAQAMDGCSTDGCRAMLSFALKVADKAEDFVGQLQPGYFTDPQAFIDYLAAQPRYVEVNIRASCAASPPPLM